MKKTMLKIWDALHLARERVAFFFYTLRDFFYRVFLSPPIVRSVEDTLDYMINNKCSVSRFGDGEIKLAAGRDIAFQKADPMAVKKMREVLSSDETGHIVCLADIFGDRSRYSSEYNAHWKKHLAQFRPVWYKYIQKNKVYFNASVTRQYISLKNKDCAGEWFNKFQKLWDGRDVVFIEGEKSRLGVGNDLFDNAKSIKRVLGPVKNAFDEYENILSFTKENISPSSLILIALGPCATALAYDLHLLGFESIDIGHIDIEYEWYLMGALKREKIDNKYVNEAGAKQEISDNMDDKYLSEIIVRFTGEE